MGPQIVLLDFGLARGSVQLIESATTAVASVFGYTLNYASLEQIEGGNTDGRSDLYSLAATLYNLITGTTPPGALSRAAAIVSSRPDPLQPADELNEHVTREVAEALRVGMSLNPEDRPGWAAEFRRFADYSRMQVLIRSVPRLPMKTPINGRSSPFQCLK
jgi:serine/threonine protein kinase